MFMYDVTKTSSYARNFVYSELFANGGKDDNVVLEFEMAMY